MLSDTLDTALNQMERDLDGAPKAYTERMREAVEKVTQLMTSLRIACEHLPGSNTGAAHFNLVDAIRALDTTEVYRAERTLRETSKFRMTERLREEIAAYEHRVRGGV